MGSLRANRVGLGGFLAVMLLLGVDNLATAADILVYDHNTVNQRAQDALNSLGLTYTVGNASTFNTLLTSQAWDLVVVDAPSTFPSWAPLVSYVTGGGRAIMSFWTLQTEPALAAAFDVTQTATFTTPQNVFRWDTSHPIFNDPNSVGDLTSWTDNWADDGDHVAVQALSGAVALAGFTTSPSTNDAAIVLGNSGRTIYNGFLFDELNDPTGTNLFANEINFLLTPQAVPEPATLTMLSLGGLSLLGYGWRRRKASPLNR